MPRRTSSSARLTVAWTAGFTDDMAARRVALRGLGALL